MRQRLTIDEWFWAKVQKGDGCWLWTGLRFPKGYGLAQVAGKNVRVHRVSYELAHGPIPTDLQLDHLCRNKACVNPAHLEAVTATENLRRGPQTKLDREAVIAIRASSEPQAVIAARYGVDRSCISLVRARKTWVDV